MNRKMMMVLLAIGAICSAACGVDEEPMRPRGGSALPAQAGPDLVSMTVEERNAEMSKSDQQAASLMRWPAGTPGERDVMADVRTCREKLLADEQYVRAHPLQQVSLFGECMKGFGWEVDPEAVNAAS